MNKIFSIIFTILSLNLLSQNGHNGYFTNSKKEFIYLNEDTILFRLELPSCLIIPIIGKGIYKEIKNDSISSKNERCYFVEKKLFLNNEILYITEKQLKDSVIELIFMFHDSTPIINGVVKFLDTNYVQEKKVVKRKIPNYYKFGNLFFPKKEKKEEYVIDKKYVYFEGITNNKGKLIINKSLIDKLNNQKVYLKFYAFGCFFEMPIKLKFNTKYIIHSLPNYEFNNNYDGFYFCVINREKIFVKYNDYNTILNLEKDKKYHLDILLNYK